MGKYKKYYKSISTSSKKDGNEKKTSKLLSKPFKIEKKEISTEHKKLIKNALIIQQREFAKIKRKSNRINNIVEKHNLVLKKKSFDNVMDIFNLLKFFK